MTHQALPSAPEAALDPGRQLAQLNELLRLVERVAGRPANDEDADLDANARLSAAYAEALPVVQRRFEALAGETAGWAAAGVEALLAAGEAEPPRAAALRLADRIAAALSALAALLPPRG